MIQYFMVALMLTVSAFLISCGSDGDSGSSWCPGTICSNCATDCNIECTTGTETCVGGSFFDADPNLRCAYCS